VRRLREDDRGVTVPELLIVVLVFALLLVATLGILESAVKTERGQQSRADSLDGLRLAMARVTKDIRQAMSVDPSSTASRLQMTTIVDGDTVSVVYEVVGGTLLRRIDGGAARAVAERVLTGSARPFCYDPPTCTGASPSTTPPAVLVLLEIRPDVSDAPSIKLATTIKLRNA